MTEREQLDEILDNNAIYLEDYQGGKVTKVKPEAKTSIIHLLATARREAQIELLVAGIALNDGPIKDWCKKQFERLTNTLTKKGE